MFGGPRAGGSSPAVGLAQGQQAKGKAGLGALQAWDGFGLAGLTVEFAGLLWAQTGPIKSGPRTSKSKKQKINNKK